jgi:hypothetical protein
MSNSLEFVHGDDDENGSNDDDDDATLISNFDQWKKEYLNFIFWKIKIYDSEW